MADSSQKTEQPTPRKLQKARKDGDFPSAREFVAAIQFCAFVTLAAAYFPPWIQSLQRALRTGLLQAFSSSLSPADLLTLITRLANMMLKPLAILGAILVGLTLLVNLAATNLGFSFARLAPKFGNLNPARRLKEMPATNIAHFLQAAVMIPVMFWLTWSMIRDRLPEILRLPLMPIGVSAAAAGMLLGDALKKASWVMLALGAVMLARDRARYSKRQRMSKQEIRDESKENEGNPQTKARVRRIQRDLLRRNMMREVPNATAIIVNPTHYAVAIKYKQGAMTAPEVVAKGKNFLAARIRQRALENQVPIIENPPLAQALYKSVEIGQEIPPHLYRAVAEILAYIFKLMNHSGVKSR
ncbi:MAG: EscU/YscU/HrcU family type III secretion system export apparatus switch protein [Terriglobia bacterium]